MKRHKELECSVSQNERQGSVVLSVDVREVQEDGETYFVAECLEIPGCVSEGSTSEEARANIEEAMRLCLSVVMEDCFSKMMVHRQPVEQAEVKDHFRFSVSTTPQLEYA